ncbi:MAG: tetratricopeptide repeat protein [Candidatus Heimdallarchaeota archaeon]
MIWSRLADILWYRKEYDKVLECLLKAAELEPNLSGTWNNLACVYQELGELEKSFESADKAIELDPNNSHAWHTLGDAFEMKGNDEAAFDNYKKAVELNPSSEQHLEALEFIVEKMALDFDVAAFLIKIQKKKED